MAAAKTLTLQPRDKLLLAHVRRYRLTTAEVAHRLFFPDVKLPAVRAALRRLTAGGFVQARPLGPSRYYQLTAPMARRFGEPEETANRLGDQALPRAYGVLAFCCLSEVFRERLTPQEFRAWFPEFVAAGLDIDNSDNYYLDDDGTTVRLGHIVVDLGGSSERLLRKCRNDIVRRGLDIPVFRDVLETAFTIAIVTAEEDKRRALQAALEAQPLLVPVRLAVVPQLAEVLPRGGEEEA